jgi:16S rRNA (guanine(966)-N(2))-methyltransferase RsmD
MVRVIAGTYRSRILKTLEGQETRPTSDRLKETLFNLLQGRIAGSTFLDCFAGSGSVGLEAMSRGAARVTFLEISRKACATLLENLNRLGLRESPECEVLCLPADTGLKNLAQKGRNFDIVFLDPPYLDKSLYSAAFALLAKPGLLAPEGWVVAEHSKRLTLPAEWEPLTRFRELRQGDSVLSLYRVIPKGKTPAAVMEQEVH